MTYSPITALPTAPSRARPSTFASEADAFLAALSTFRTEVNTAGTYFDTVGAAIDGDASTASTKAGEALQSATDAANSASAAAASAASAGATAWSSGASYSAGALVYSTVDYNTYRAQTTHSGQTTDPSEDTTNWVAQGGGGGGLTSQTATTTATTQTAIATYAKTDYTGMELTVVADDDTNRTITKLLVVHDGTTAVATQYGEVNTSTALATYDVDISGANVRLLATPASATSTEFTVKENLFAPVTP